MLEGGRIAGFDPSLTSFGVAFVGAHQDFFRYETHVWKTSRKGAARLDYFYTMVMEAAISGEFDLFVVEGYAYARANNQAKMGELGGVVRLALHQAGVQWVEVAPTALKKFVTGKGNAPKDKVMMEAFRRFGIDVPTTDEVDAVALALMGAVGYAGMEIDLPKVNLEALKKVDFPSHG